MNLFASRDVKADEHVGSVPGLSAAVQRSGEVSHTLDSFITREVVGIFLTIKPPERPAVTVNITQDVAFQWIGLIRDAIERAAATETIKPEATP